MPCDSVRTVSVNLTEMSDKKLIVQALKAMGHEDARLSGETIYFTVGKGYNATTAVIRDGKVEITGSNYSESQREAEKIAAELKEGYARAAIKNAASRYGFTVKQIDKAGKSFTACKRFAMGGKADEIKVTITPKGEIKTETGKISGPNHKAADDFLNFIAKLAGAPVAREKRRHVHHDVELGTHLHEGGADHSH